MGARAGRLLRTFNLENRVDREISKTKPKPAPRHVTTADSAPDISEVNKKNDALLAWLKQVYVKSRDPISQVTVAAELKQAEHVGHRPLKSSLRGDHFLISDITAVPQGKLLIVEALTALNNHKLSPQTWTAEKIAKEYTLDLADAKALTKFFIPFNVKIIPPKSEERKQIKDS
ncbi:NADH dehydrogenase [ubiquinone] 1 alpha subcomplex assembly factor 4 isoform X2 [Electrophorus electricus]|uniref:NADH dehydrogenase [ubiquinone] 1 alpha subcomplex assembly factor 4 isoform X2 n=1 Tax=Electrophorus electricus TaxID=8005 RepID=UPI000F0A00E5|nr:NADH dehydrogenase [ubiquinone] 1 alpha subcomplex assembly factor 4 isoform X2 [Electrophorus electricus]